MSYCGRTTTVKEIEERCKSSGLKPLLDVFEEGAEVGVTRLLAAFYFRQSGDRSNERTFEFTHKSFGEYLTALRIVRAMERIQKQLDKRKEDMEEGWDERQALQHWAEVCGPTRMDSYLFDFLKDEVALRDVAKLKKLQKTFGHLIGVVLRQGMPMEKVEPPLVKFHEANRWAINAEEALLAALTACGQATQHIFELDLPTPESFGTWIKRLQGQRTVAENVVVASLSISFLDLSHARLEFADFYGARLDRTSFSKSRFSSYEGNLYGVNFRGAQLHKVNFKGIRLSESIFRNARLLKTDFQRATLNKVNFDAARLIGVNFENARFDKMLIYRESTRHRYRTGTSFAGSTLVRVNFKKARLYRTSFADARLDSVNFQKADLHEVNFSGARLKGSDFEGASLKDIVWDERTDWHHAQNLHDAVDVPEALREKFGMAIQYSIFSDRDEDEDDLIVYKR